MFAVCVIALFCMLSVSHSATLVCEDLVQPLDQLDIHHLEVKRALVAGGVSNPAQLEHFKRRDSAAIKFFNESSQIFLTRIFGFNDSCQYLQSNVTLEGSSFAFKEYNISATFLYTSCQDCVVMRFDKAEELVRLYLFSVRREVEQKEMEEFKAQVECLRMSPPFLMDPTKELCPVKISSDPAETQEKTGE